MKRLCLGMLRSLVDVRVDWNIEYWDRLVKFVVKFMVLEFVYIFYKRKEIVEKVLD